MRFCTPPPAKKRRGVTTVEFALVIPVFFLFILSLVEIGRAMMVTNLIHNAARAGCREGALPNKSDSDITTVVNNAIKSQGLKNVSTTVTVNNATANASTAQTRDEITVTVAVPVNDNTWLPVARLIKGTLVGRYTMSRE